MACRLLVICLGLLALCCGDRARSAEDRTDKTSGEMSYRFTREKRSVAQPLDQGAGQAGYEYVEVEVTKVLNPKQFPVIFEIHYQPRDGQRIFLGSFGLYPSDNPGKFIVGTQGKLKDEGSIILSLIIPDNLKATDILEVTTKRIALTKGDQR